MPCLFPLIRSCILQKCLYHLFDIFKHFAKDFWRLRVGVGHPGHKDQVLSFVLNAASKKEQQLIDQSLDTAIDAMSDAYVGDMEAAMRLLHNKQ